MRDQCKQPVDPLHIAAQRPPVGRHRALGSAYGPQRWCLREPQQLCDLVARAGGKRGQAGFTRARIVRGRTRPEASGCGLCFAVSDTGTGIDLDRGIGIFWRLPANAGGKRQHRIGAVHCTTHCLGDRGSLRVTSTAGAGTTFSFSFLAPLTEGPTAEWPVLARTPMQPATQTGDAAPTPHAMPADQALEELAHLALHGRLTDIARWIDVQSASGDGAPSSLRSAICWNGLIFLPSSS